ncbi:MAG: S8 family serine peptidase [Burkholderiaceae bacterium]|nr:S8 family serine peptidase [Burkholderiaceae bacterium]
MFRSIRWLGLLLAALVLAWGPGGSAPAQAAGGPRQAAAAPRAPAEDPDDARVIVKVRSGSAMALEVAGRPRLAGRLGRQLALASMQDGHVLGRRTQSLRARGLSSSQLAARLAALPDVEWAVPARRKTFTAVVPNDPFYADHLTGITPVVGQWYLRAPDATRMSAIDAEAAWAITTGSGAITVATLDTGVIGSHPDLAGKLHPGYDFVSRSSSSADGNGRDADASDPGDWSTTADSCGAADSSWHGTQVAGLIGAATDNGIGMAGVGRNVMVLPVRVLGKCGGFDDDIIAAMRWAGGLGSSPVANAHPARVLNLSLGSSGSCSAAYRDAIAELSAAGVSVVVAAGNDTGHAVNEPANCPGVIAVAGLRHAGTKVGYSNIGPEVAIAAPAGNCVNDTGPCLYPLLTTTNAGKTTPGANIYSDSFQTSLGTSFAAPIVAGTVGLMLSVDPRMAPAEVKAALQRSARPFPTSGAQEAGATACHPPGAAEQNECYCTTSTCGAGMLDAGGAVAAARDALLAPTAAIALSSGSPVAGDSITLSAGGSTVSEGRTIAGYQWTLTRGADLAALVGATDGASVTLATRAAGEVVVQLTVTDSTNASRSSSQSITIAAAPVVVSAPAEPGGGGGGGALGWGWIAGLAAAVRVLARSAPGAAGAGRR